MRQTREGALAEERPVGLGGLGNLSVDDSAISRMWHSCVCEEAADRLTKELFLADSVLILRVAATEVAALVKLWRADSSCS